MNAYQSKRVENDAAIYLFARCEQLIENYARSSGLSARVLTERVAELISAQTFGEVLGAQNPVPPLRRNRTSGNQPVEQMALAGGSHRRAQVKRAYTLSPKALAARRRNAAIARAAGLPETKAPFRKGFSYEGKHWTQQPKNKARLRAQMKRLREEYLTKVRKGKA